MTTVVAGVGFRRAAPAAEIVALVKRALGEAALARGALRGIATLAALADTAAFREAARHLSVLALAVDPAALAGTEDRLRTRSARSLGAHGVESVAEAAALGAIGPGARLILPRITSPGVTCALAEDVWHEADALPLPPRSGGEGRLARRRERGGGSNDRDPPLHCMPDQMSLPPPGSASPRPPSPPQARGGGARLGPFGPPEKGMCATDGPDAVRP